MSNIDDLSPEIIAINVDKKKITINKILLKKLSLKKKNIKNISIGVNLTKKLPSTFSSPNKPLILPKYSLLKPSIFVP